MHQHNFIKRAILLILLSIIMVKSQAQVGLNFQGVARTTNNVVLASQSISLRLSILQGSENGIVEYSETKVVNTNAQGLFTAVIGETGAISTLGNFKNINWKNTPKFLKIEIDPSAGTNFVTMGTSQFQYSPYAILANNVAAENLLGIVPVNLGGTGVSSLDGLKTSLNINNISNIPDLDKPISSLTQKALDQKLQIKDTINLSTRIDSKLDRTELNKVLSLKDDVSNKSTAVDLGGASPSDILYPTQKAVKSYVDASKVASK